MAWVGDFAVTMGAGIALRFTINIPERQETVLHNLREIAPTFYLAAPRSWDNMLTTIQVRMEDSTRLKKCDLSSSSWTAALAAERRKLDGGEPTLKERLLRPLGEWLVCGPIKDQFGLARLRGAFTGGEAMGEDTFVFYRALGIKLRQLYGQTESSAYNAIQSMDEVRLHTVGRPLPGVEVQISASGEILIRSGSVFAGYFKQDEATRETLDRRLAAYRRRRLSRTRRPSGRARASLRCGAHRARASATSRTTSRTGFKFSPYIKDVAVLGTRPRDACGDHLHRQGSRRPLGRGARHLVHFVRRPVAKARGDRAGRRRGQARQRTLPEGLQLRRFVCLHKEFDADDGEITRTRKTPAQRRRGALSADHRRHLRQPADGAMKAQITYETGEVGVIERDACRCRRPDAWTRSRSSSSAVNGALVGLMYSLVAIGIVLIYKSSSVPNLAQGVDDDARRLCRARIRQQLQARRSGWRYRWRC